MDICCNQLEWSGLGVNPASACAATLWEQTAHHNACDLGKVDPTTKSQNFSARFFQVACVHRELCCWLLMGKGLACHCRQRCWWMCHADATSRTPLLNIQYLGVSHPKADHNRKYSPKNAPPIVLLFAVDVRP
eukprot:5327491-Amphidinium_carterae.1